MGDAEAAFPVPGPHMVAEFLAWPAGRPIHRVHKSIYGSTQFNGSGFGNARFSPIASAQGKTVPTLYGGATFECALMETVFHDVPHIPGFKAYDKKNLESMRASIIGPNRELRLVNLSGKALRKLGIARTVLLESPASDYPRTRPWAEALHRQFHEADGLCWVSRQDDEAHALVLFGDRIRRGDLKIIQPPADIVNDPKPYLQVLELARMIGVDLL
jgi:hypothetical protein